ncbi:MAG: NAD(P)H-hydrate epimerase [Candidatus Marinimicrobia bacterium]|nr:NAD(P)H-hydrate epimerase [Candidatus Neomarinimicrobiota bacterium]
MNLVIPQIDIKDYGTLSIDQFKELDYQSVEKYKIPVELLMENAGLSLARLTATYVNQTSTILIGVGPGHNGGGGLVAARRLAGWGYSVHLHLYKTEVKPLTAIQLDRATAVGAIILDGETPDVFIDAYLGFSQRLPLPTSLQNIIHEKNKLNCPKISLDIPTGFNPQSGELLFTPDTILTLAAMKTELLKIFKKTELYIADLGLPHQVYTDFGLNPFEDFHMCGLVKSV